MKQCATASLPRRGQTLSFKLSRDPDFVEKPRDVVVGPLSQSARARPGASGWTRRARFRPSV